MQAQTYINVVDMLNNEVCEECGNVSFYFKYSSCHYADNISFMGLSIYNSENDTSIESETELEELLRERMLEFTNKLMKWQHYDGTED